MLMLVNVARQQPLSPLMLLLLLLLVLAAKRQDGRRRGAAVRKWRCRHEK